MSGSSPGTPVIRRADLFTETWKGVTDRLTKLYDPSSLVDGPRQIQVVPCANTDDAEKLLQNQDLKLQLPFIAIGPGSIEPNTGSYNASVLRRFGFSSTISQDRSTWTVLKLFPVVATFSVALVTDDMLTILRMIDRWMANELWGFKLKYEDYEAKIKVVVDKNFSMPQRLPNQAGADQFRLNTSLRAETYSGSLWQVPSVFTVDTTVGLTPYAMSSLEAIQRQEQVALTIVYDAPDHEPTA